MTNIKDIPVHDIELFLNKNNVEFNKNTIYTNALKLMKKGTIYYTDSIIEWMMAYNLLKSKIIVPLYSKSEILNLSVNELKSLTSLLKMKTNNINHIVSILKYLHKLEYENESLFPSEIFRELISNMNYDSIKETCNSSRDMKILCHTKDMRNLLISKFMKDSLNTRNFTEDELNFYEKVKPLKRRMCLSNDSEKQTILNISYNNLLFTLYNNILTYQESDINQIISSEIYLGYDEINNVFEKQDINIILYNDGIVMRDDKTKIPITNKVINIESFPDNKNNINIITNKKECYSWNGNLYQYTTPFNVIQRTEYYCLTDKGEVYVKNNEDLEIPDNIEPDAFGEVGQIINGIFDKLEEVKYYKIHGLPRIAQLTTKEIFLSEDGGFWYVDYDDLTPVLSNKYKYNNIIQIYELKHVNYYLDNKGTIFTPIYKIETFKNLIEIAINSDESYIYALDNEMNLYVYNISGQFLQSYDLLKF
jgi:hypothetical protein